VLYYTVQRRQREIGICRAIGAPAGAIAWGVTSRFGLAVLTGAVAGLAIGLLVVRSLATLFYGVQATDPGQLARPLLAIAGAAALAALPPVLRAIRVDPTVVLRAD
jgi:ABC-type lipoprotein release transport system permease subunit